MPIEIVAKPSDWLSTDQERWAAFLDTETGRRLLPNLAESAPQLLSEGDINKILIRSGEVRGYQNVLQNLILMAHPSAKGPVSTSTTEYPPLTDDAKWNDGQTLVLPPDEAEEKIETETPPPVAHE